jgi:hypothetical protein
MIKRSVVAGAVALALLTGSGLAATATPTTSGPVELTSQVTPLLDTPPPLGGVLGGVEGFLQRLFAFLFGGGSSGSGNGGGGQGGGPG